MKMKGLYYIIILALCSLLSSCASELQQPKQSHNKKNIVYSAILTDPVIKKDFRSLKSIAMSATVYNNGNNPYFNEQTITKLNEASAVLIDRLQNHYHLDAGKYKIHTYIGKNKADSCYQYYSSFALNSIGKTCQTFGSCYLCNQHINIVKSRNMRVIHTRWWNNKDNTTLIDTFKLRNGDFVYLGLALTPL